MRWSEANDDWAFCMLAPPVAELGELRRRLLGTLGLLVIFGVLHLMPLPGLDPKQAAAAGTLMSLMAIGIAPAATAFVMVEWAALLWPGWRRLRVSLTGRAKLDRAVVILGMALGAMQVFGVVLSLEHLNDVDARVPLLQGNSEALVGLALFAGILIALFTARALSKLCIVNGFSVLILLRELRLSNVHADASAAASASLSHTPHPWAMLCGFVLPVLATVACFRAYGREPDALAPLELPAPASSSHPSAFVVSLLGLPAALAMFSGDAVKPLLSWVARFGENPWLRAVLTLAFGMLLLWVFSRPRRVRALFSRAVGEGAAAKLAQQAFRESIAPTLLYLLTLALSDLLLETELDISRLTPLIAAAVAIILDFLVILRVHRSGNWACAWRDPRPYVFPVVQRVLRRSEIAAREVSLAQATLFRIFGPFALTEVWVPAPLVARATELIEAALAPGSETQLEAEASDLAEHPERSRQRRKRLAVLAALAALACLATVVARH